MALDFEYDIFLSHSSKDKPAVRELAERLKGDGLRMWLDEWVIQPGDSIPLAIERGLESSRTLVLFMSKNTFASKGVTLERHTALFRDPTNEQRRFIPLRLDDCDINDTLKQFAHIDWREKDEGEYTKLYNACAPARESTNAFTKVNEPDVVSRVLTGHTSTVQTVTITSDGKHAVSASSDSTIRIWHLPSGECTATLKDEPGILWSAVPILDGEQIVSASGYNRIRVWHVKNGCLKEFVGHQRYVNGVLVAAASADGRHGFSGSDNADVHFWNLRTGGSVSRDGHHKTVRAVAMTPDGQVAISASDDGTLRVWDMHNPHCIASLTGHTDSVTTVAMTPDGQRAVSGSRDRTLKVWNLQKMSYNNTLEGHTKPIHGVALTHDGSRAASVSDDCTLRIWDTVTGDCMAVLSTPDGELTAVGITLDGTYVFTGAANGTVRIWDIGRVTAPSNQRSARYTNAKVLLVGGSGVGKSGLAIRLAENKFEPTVSTDAHWATQLKLPHDTDNGDTQDGAVEEGAGRTDPKKNTGVTREIWLWDFAGQADYRLIHQLFMDETALAVLVFNPQSENPFDGLGQWDRDLARAARREFAKLLVAGRCDRGGLMVSRETVEEFSRLRGFAGYLETSALTGDGCDRLRDEIVRRIDWDSIPWTASPRIFKLLKGEILRLHDEGVVLLRMGELKQQLEMRLVEEAFTVEELRAVVGLLAGPGLVWKLEFGDIVLLQPEWINKYAAAVIRSVRTHIGEIGVIDEAQVLAGELNYTMDLVRREADGGEEAVKVEMQRLDPSDEAIVLRAMHQMFVDHGLCVREELEGGGRQLIFPSYFKQELPTDPGHPPILVNYQFEGHAEEIYATLVVQLCRTKAFENGDLWRYAADFKSATGARLGLKMVRHEDRNPQISVYFDSDVQDDTKVTFIKYVHEHLLEKAQDVVRLRTFVCPHCEHPVRDTELAREILHEEGANAEIRCQQRKCDRRFSLWDVIEQKFASKEFQERVRELEEKANAAIDNESRELILEGHARVITGEAGQIYRCYTGSDHGIDGVIEFKDDSGQASGKRLYLQLKSSDSYSYQRKPDGAEIFPPVQVICTFLNALV